MVHNPLMAFGCILLACSSYAESADPPRPGSNGENSVVFAPDGKWLVTGGTDGLVRIRDGTTGAVLASLAGHQSVVNTVAVSPDGRTIASVSDDFSTRLWDVERRTERWSLVVPRALRDSHFYCVMAVAFAPDGRTIATGDNGGYIQIWDVATGELRESWVADPRKVEQVLYSPDGATIASVGRDPAVKLWDARSHALRRSLAEPGSKQLYLAYSADGATLAVAHELNLTLWNPTSGLELERLSKCPDFAQSLAFTPDNHFLVFAGIKSSHLLSLKGQDKSNSRWSSLIPPPNIDYFTAIAVSPDNRWVAHCFQDFGKFPQSSFKLIAIH